MTAYWNNSLLLLHSSSLSKQDISNRRFLELKSARKVGFMNSTWNWVSLGLQIWIHTAFCSQYYRDSISWCQNDSVFTALMYLYSEREILKQVMTTNLSAESFSMPMPFCPMLLPMMLTLAHDLFAKSSVHTNKVLINPYLYFFLCRKFPT